jgi:hypothetical protein
MPQIDQAVYDIAQLSLDQRNGRIIPHGFHRSINIFQRVNGVIHVCARLCGYRHPSQRKVWRAGCG